MATQERIDAEFGNRARIRARFHPNGRVRQRKLHGCTGGPAVTEFGVFEGTIRFHGEGGYTDFEATKVPGSLTSRPRQVCTRHRSKSRSHAHRHRSEHPTERETITTIEASSSGGVRLEAVRLDAHPKESIFFATASEVSEGNLIERRALTIGQLGSFSFDPQLNSAELDPPEPAPCFNGIDEYATRWQGPLTVSFPGFADVPLTGRDFSWSLTSRKSRSSGASLAVAFSRRLRAPGIPSQGSGSHSQAFWDARLSWSR